MNKETRRAHSNGVGKRTKRAKARSSQPRNFRPGSEHDVPIDSVSPGTGFKREVGDLRPLMESLETLGQLEAIGIDDRGGVVFGHRRLEAMRQLGSSTIRATVLDLDDLNRQLACLDENLIRKDLSALERGEWVAERKRLYEMIHPEARHGAASPRAEKRDPSPGSFLEDASAKTRRGRSTIGEDVQIGAMPAEVRDRLRGLPIAEKKGQLLALARKPVKEQVEMAAALAEGRAKSVNEAARQLGGDDDSGDKPAEIFKDAAALEGVATRICSARDALAGLVDGWRFAASADVECILETAESVLEELGRLSTVVEEQLIPREACGECAAAPSEECEACGGTGWFSRADLADGATEDYQPEETEDVDELETPTPPTDGSPVTVSPLPLSRLRW